MVKTWMEIRIESKQDATVWLFVTCADETLTAQEMYNGTANDCAIYTDYYFGNGMKVEVVYHESQTK